MKIHKKLQPFKFRRLSAPDSPRQWLLAITLGLIVLYLLVGVGVVWSAYIKQHTNQRLLAWYPLPAAIVGTNIIPLSRYERDVTAINRYISVSNTADQYKNVTVRSEVLQRLTRAALIKRLAHRYGVTITKDQVEAAYTAAASEEPGSVEQVLDRYYGFTPNDFKVWIAEYLLEEAVHAQIPKARTISHILIAVDTNAPDTTVQDKKAATQTLIDQLNGGADFATVAKQNSNDVATRDNGGLLGNLTRGTATNPIIDRAFEDAAFAAPVDTIVGPVRSSQGWHIIKITTDTGYIDSNFDTILQQEHQNTSIQILVRTR